MAKKQKRKKEKKSGKWRNADPGFIRLLSKGRHNRITGLMKLLTRIGDGWFWLVLTIIFLFIEIYAGMAFGFALIIQIGLQIALKRIFSRDRPYIKHEDITNLMIPPDKFSFPSGHTAGAFAVAFVLWFFYPVLFIPGLILAILIGISRMYLGLHYPSDVLAGVLLGFLSARLAVFFVLLIEL